MRRVLSVVFTTLPPQYQERRALVRLLKWAYRFSPIVALDTAAEHRAQPRARGSASHCTGFGAGGLSFGTGSGGAGGGDSASSGSTAAAGKDCDPRYCGLNLDVSGCARLFRGEARLLARMRAELSARGIESRLCIAPTLGAAWALSRYGKKTQCIVEQQELQKALAPLPVDALRISEKTIQGLCELNITQIAHLLALSPKALRTRFERELVLRLHQALGVEQEPLLAVPFVASLRVGRNFAGAITQYTALQQAARVLLEELLAQVKEHSQKISRLIIELKAIDAPNVCKEIPLSMPTADRFHLRQLLDIHLERISMGGGVESLALHAPRTQHIESRDSSFIAAPEEDAAARSIYRDSRLAKLLDSLYEQLGERNVLQADPAESHIPEHTVRYVPLADCMNGRKQLSGSRVAQVDRPSMLFYRPQEIRAMAVLPDTPPFWIKWQQHTYPVTAGIGPERIAPAWWGDDGELCETRDYFKVQLPDGLWLWIFRELERSKWFLHGIWA